MKYFLDTNICIYIIKQKPIEIIEKFKRLSPNQVGISSITLSELMYGVEKSQHKEKNLAALEKFISSLLVFPFDDTAAEAYGKIRTLLEKNGTPIGPMDLLIAAHAKSLQLILISNNIKEFSRIPHLKTENWVAK